MPDELTLEWSYAPTDFFEEPLESHGDGYKLEIQNGRAVATLFPGSPENEQRFEKIHAHLESLFLGAQPKRHRPYQLPHYRVVRLRPDGSREISVSGGASMKMRGSADYKLTDKEGNVLRDSRLERIQATKEAAQRAAKYRNDPVAAAMLKSHNNAVNDPDNELVHLYEIRDALRETFGRESKARTSLGITKSDWNRLGELADHAPLRQGQAPR